MMILLLLSESKMRTFAEIDYTTTLIYFMCDTETGDNNHRKTTVTIEHFH